MTDAESEEILGLIGSVNQLCIDSESDRVMRELGQADQRLPIAAIEEVREHRDIFVPLLMQSVESATAKVRSGEKVDEESAFFALFLLTELKVDEAFPILRDVFLLTGEGASEISGDAVHDLLPPLLAQFSHGNIDVIDEFIRGPDSYLLVGDYGLQVSCPRRIDFQTGCSKRPPGACC